MTTWHNTTPIRIEVGRDQKDFDRLIRVPELKSKPADSFVAVSSRGAIFGSMTAT